MKRRDYGLMDLLHKEGYGEDLSAYLDMNGLDSVVAGICRDCGVVYEVAPDEQRGWCDECQRDTVNSALVLAGMI